MARPNKKDPYLIPIEDTRDYYVCALPPIQSSLSPSILRFVSLPRLYSSPYCAPQRLRLLSTDFRIVVSAVHEVACLGAQLSVAVVEV
jgi:hypothetical protein